MQILVVDDEPAVRDSLERALRLEGYEIALAADGAQALATLAKDGTDAVVLDVMMPGVDGLEVCRRMRSAGDRTPVLMLTARDDVSDRVAGLDAGADDYVVKPFALDELLARLRALLRRSGVGAGGQTLDFEDLQLDPVSHQVKRGEPRDRPHANRVLVARAVPAPPAPGADPPGDLRPRVGLRLRARARTRSRYTSAICAARPSPAGSRGCCTPCAASATSCARSDERVAPAWHAARSRA